MSLIQATRRSCGGSGMLSIWSPNGKVPRALSPERQFKMPTPTPGRKDMSVDLGCLRQTVIKITTTLDTWPPPTATMPATLADWLGTPQHAAKVDTNLG